MTPTAMINTITDAHLYCDHRIRVDNDLSIHRKARIGYKEALL
jgi:hypothetical protein